MEPRTLRFIANACAAPLLHADPDLEVSGISTDTRKIKRGDVFLALSGDRFDGHTFLDAAAEKGAAAIIGEKERISEHFARCGTIRVENPRGALGCVAAAYRLGFDLPVIAVGGSNGKTTTKELLASVLNQRGPALSSEASFNNDVGVPLTLLRLERQHRAAVCEVGTNHPGELAPLLRMLRPRYGVVTSIGREHLEFFGDLAGVAREEGSIAEALPKEGVLFLNMETPFAAEVASRASCRVVRVGFRAAADVIAYDLKVSEKGSHFRVTAWKHEYDGEFRIRLLGRHQVTNALLALAVAIELGLTREEIADALANCPSPRMRMQIMEIRGLRLLDDAYNANADSTLAALETLHDLPCDGRRVAILGDMAELGEEAIPAHAEVARRAAELKIDQVFAVGKMAGEMARAARAAGLNEVAQFDDVEGVAAAARAFVRPGDLILLKASRATQLERVRDALRAENPH